MTTSLRQFGPLRFEVTAPPGWSVVEDDDPLALPFLEPAGPPSGPCRIVELLVDSGDTSVDEAKEDGWHLEVETSGWRLERDSYGSTRWSLPDPSGGTLWTAVVQDQRIRVSVGPRLLDRDQRTIANPLRYPLDQILAIHLLGDLGSFVVHGAGWARDGQALVAAGVSGAGKTTLSRLLASVDSELVGLSDDRVLLTHPLADATTAGWRVTGTPWAGEGRVACAAQAALAGMVLLEHADTLELVRLHPREAFARLVPAISVPWYDPDRSAVVLDLLGELLNDVPVELLRFRPEPAAARRVLEVLGRGD